MKPCMPHEHHPALADYADSVRKVPPAFETAYYHSPIPMHVQEVLRDHGATPLPQKTLTREKAAMSLDWKFGCYVWSVWVDELGRMIGGDDMQWVPNPEAFMYGGEWNPVGVSV